MTVGNRQLRIAQVAPVGTPVRPGAAESVQQLVWLTCEELVARGHDVTLYATGDSETSAELRHVFDRGYEHDEQLWDWQFTEYTHAGYAYSQAQEFDVVHCQTGHFGLPFTPFVATGNVHTPHVESEPAAIEAYRSSPDVQLVVSSKFQAGSYEGCANVALIPHGIETAAFPFGERAGDYLLFLGRMIEDKGPSEAIDIAREAGMRLILAGPPAEDFEERLAPAIDGQAVIYAGPVEAQERDRLLAGAAALLHPLQYPEPFGLVAIEAMACGTPVLSIRTGAVPELVDEGVTGYLADSWQELASLVPRACVLDRRAIRARAIERFDYRRMVDAHERLYRRLVAERDG